jgi:hypothetical protein
MERYYYSFALFRSAVVWPQWAVCKDARATALFPCRAVARASSAEARAARDCWRGAHSIDLNY